MIPSGVEVFVALGRLTCDGASSVLLVLWRSRLDAGARSGALFVFFGERKSALKILFFDGSGMCLFYKRLGNRIFRIPEALVPGVTSVELSERELDDLLDAIDVEQEGAPASSRVRRCAR